VLDTANHRIRTITTAGVVSTLAGSGTAGSADGTGVAASFNAPLGITVDSSFVRAPLMAGCMCVPPARAHQLGLPLLPQNVYVGDSSNHRIRKITTPAGVVSTLAGSTFGATDATGTNAKFNFPAGVAVDSKCVFPVCGDLITLHFAYQRAIQPAFHQWERVCCRHE
jgi:hypothetical protein